MTDTEHSLVQTKKKITFDTFVVSNNFDFSEQEVIRLKKARNRKWKRYALIGLATAGGGALIGLTGGLAAPLVAAGAGSIFLISVHLSVIQYKLNLRANKTVN